MPSDDLSFIRKALQLGRLACESAETLLDAEQSNDRLRVQLERNSLRFFLGESVQLTEEYVARQEKKSTVTLKTTGG